jgi:D-methionine transport system substrate-binding protein
MNVKKTGLAAVLVLAAALVFAGGSKAASGSTLTIGASPTPHAEILELIKDDLAAEGITLKIVVYDDYIQPNEALLSKDLDANYFQHQPYLESNPAWAAAITNVIGVHVEPYGIYAGKAKKLGDLKSGAQIAINSDPSNQGRALLLLQAHKLLTIKGDLGYKATIRDIDNPKGFKFVELEAAQLPRSLSDVDAAGINGNYAIEAGLKPSDALIIEGKDSPYVNYVSVRKGEENAPWVKPLKKALQSKKVKDYIAKTWPDGAVLPGF